MPMSPLARRFQIKNSASGAGGGAADQCPVSGKSPVDKNFVTRRQAARVFFGQTPFIFVF